MAQRADDESPFCEVCGRQTGVDTDSILLRVGRRQQSKKHGGFYFHPDLFEDRRDVRWFHLHCLQSLFDFADANDYDDPDTCVFCPEDLVGEPQCYEMELGQFKIHKPDTVWTPQIDETGQVIRIYACLECVEMGIGEQEDEMVWERLGKTLASPIIEKKPALKRTGRRMPSRKAS